MPAFALGGPRRLLTSALVAFFLGAFVASAQNPPLAEVARREEERRKTTKPPTKVLTNKDLPAVASPAMPSADPVNSAGRRKRGAH